jgi:gas vesicle protein
MSDVGSVLLGAVAGAVAGGITSTVVARRSGRRGHQEDLYRRLIPAARAAIVGRERARVPEVEECRKATRLAGVADGTTMSPRRLRR